LFGYLGIQRYSTVHMLLRFMLLCCRHTQCRIKFKPQSQYRQPTLEREHSKNFSRFKVCRGGYGSEYVRYTGCPVWHGKREKFKCEKIGREKGEEIRTRPKNASLSIAIKCLVQHSGRANLKERTAAGNLEL